MDTSKCAGNRYSVPAALAGQRIAIRIGLDGLLRIYQAETMVASHIMKDRREGWSTQAEHRNDIWKNTLPQVEQRALAVYEEVL